MIGLYFGGQWFKTHFGNQYGNIELDAVLDENHEWSADATSNPVEEGAPVTDHVIEQADKLRMRCFVTDAPINASQSLSGIFTPGVNEVKTQPVFDLLRQIIKLREPVTVYTKHRIYDEMIITNVTIPRAAGVGEALEFNVDFINIRKVATQKVDVPPGVSPKKEAKAGGKNGSVARKAEPQKDAGKKQTQAVVAKPSSTLSRIFK